MGPHQQTNKTDSLLRSSGILPCHTRTRKTTRTKDNNRTTDMTSTEDATNLRGGNQGTSRKNDEFNCGK